MTPGAIEAPSDYADRIEAALRDLPSFCVVCDPDSLFDYRTGIYRNNFERGPAWERPVTLEFFDSDGISQFQQDCGIGLHGNRACDPTLTSKYAFRFVFRGRYGASQLDFPLFGDTPVDHFNSFQMRSMSEDSWNSLAAHRRLGKGKAQETAHYIRDQFARELQQKLGGPVVHGMFAHLYINGLYWGMYNVCECPSGAFAASYFGGKPADYDVIDGTQVENGDDRAWQEVMALAAGDLRDDENCRRVLEHIELDNYVDYMILNHFLANTDWYFRNFLMIRRREQGARFKFFVWDAELTMQGRYWSLNTINFANAVHSAENSGIFSPTYLLSRLRDNEEFRRHFGDRVQNHLFGEGALTPQTTIPLWRNTAQTIARAIDAESARWGDDMNRKKTYTRENDWAPEIEAIAKEFLPSRGSLLIKFYRKAGLFPAIDAPAFSSYGGEVANGATLTMAASQGDIYYTMEGSDPRLPGGRLNQEKAMKYTVPLVLTKAGMVRARAFDGTNWSALSQVNIEVK